MKNITLVLAKTLNTDVENNLPVIKDINDKEWHINTQLIGTIQGSNTDSVIMSRQNFMQLLSHLTGQLNARDVLLNIAKNAEERVINIENTEDRNITATDVVNFVNETYNKIQFIVDISILTEVLP